jgi:hypothetical protein
MTVSEYFKKSNHPITWPEGKRFAFTIFDDTDYATVGNVGLVYALLRDLGFRSTKSIWPLTGTAAPRISGDTCDNPEYLRWLLQLQQEGFEIAMHNAAPGTSIRQQTLEGLQRFFEYFGHYPYTLANHADNEESIYWGEDRLTGSRQMIYRTLLRLQAYLKRESNYKAVYQGHSPDSPLFWGDYCREYVGYVRNFIFDNINTLACCPSMPYADPRCPFVNGWFAASDGANVERFNHLISPKNQDRLEEEGGACVIYTHFASGFCSHGQVDEKFEQQMRRLAAKNGWFVPLHQLLDFIRTKNATRTISPWEKAEMEWQWLWYKLRVGGTN